MSSNDLPYGIRKFTGGNQTAISPTFSRWNPKAPTKRISSSTHLTTSPFTIPFTIALLVTNQSLPHLTYPLLSAEEPSLAGESQARNPLNPFRSFHSGRPLQNQAVIESPRDGISSIRVSKETDGIESTLTVAENEESIDQPYNNFADSSVEFNESLNSNSSLLLFIAGFVIKAIGFKLYFLISSVTLPILVLSYGCMLIIDPFQVFSLGRAYVVTKSLNLRDSICGYFSPLMSDCINYHKSIWKLIFPIRLGTVMCYICWLCFIRDNVYFSLATSGVLMRYLVEDPLEIKEMLNFDYTKSSSVAFVPIVSCSIVGCGSKCMEKIDVWKNMGRRVIHPDHKLKVTVSLILPESEYNKTLRMFQGVVHRDLKPENFLFADFES